MAKKGQNYQKYDYDLIMKVVFEKTEQGKSYSYLSTKYGVSDGTIKTWCYKYRKQDNTLVPRKRGRKKSTDETIDYKERYEILKKFLDFLEEVDQEKR